MISKITLFILTLLFPALLFSQIKPADIFTDGTILQQNKPVCIWGTAGPNETLTVEFAGQSKTAVTGRDGRWQVALDPMPASSEPRKMVVSSPIGNQQSEISNILVGEVWLAGGQSNMATTMGFYRKTTQPEIDSANDPLLRMITIPRLDFAGQNANQPKWKSTCPENTATFSGTSYYFAKNLRETLRVPVGIVVCCVGGTPAEAWMSRETLDSRPDLKRILDGYDAAIPDAATALKQYEKYETEMEAWSRAREGHRPQLPMSPYNFQRPCGLYETMFAQVIPYTVRGTIWYQGEKNGSTQAGFHYREVFSALIQEWRTELRNPDMPFLFVQLASFNANMDTVYWPELRESQSWVNDHVKNTGMAVMLDGGEAKNIHPHSKDKAGSRLSLLARNLVYGETNLVCNGPRLVSAKPNDNTIDLTFSDIGSGLLLKPADSSGFETCGSDGIYRPAEAVLQNGKIIVSSKEVSHPKYVRYGWHWWVIPTVFNKEGLPAAPFRTDNFTPETEGRYYLDTI